MAILNRTHNRTTLEYRKTHSDTLLTQVLTRIKLQRPCDTFPTFQHYFVLLQTRLLSFQTTTLHFLIVTNKCYNFNFLSLFVPLDQTFKLQLLRAQHLSFWTTTFTTFAFAFNSQPLALQTFASAFFPFQHFVLSPLTSHFSRDSLPSAYSALHFFHSLICFFFNFLFVSSCSIQFCCNPKSRLCDPCSKGFREVTHRLSYFEVC